MRKQSGFTLLELLITMVVGAVLMAIAIPNFRITIQNNRLSTQLNTLLSGMIYSRSEAIKRNTDVVICASSDQQTCSGSITGWTNGWIVYYTPPPSSATSAIPAPTSAEIIRQYPALTGSNTLKSDSNAASGQIVFQSSGMTTMTKDTQFTLCDPRKANYARVTMVSLTGRAQVLPAGTTSWGTTTLTVSCP
ncbi:MAG TPA: GspH/FimT family pseudopilin [Gammaproteobacteria bacterium]|nr:GspH/FimT family pseudopilin [Gammaproteobacteria bacterium]